MEAIMLSNKLFIQLPNKCFHNGSKEQEELYSNLTTTELKLVFSLLARATLLRHVNEENQHQTTFNVPLTKLQSRDSLFYKLKKSKKQIIDMVDNIKHPYLSFQYENDDCINFTLNKKYILALASLEKNALIDLADLMPYRSLSSIKLHLQLSYFPTYSLPLNFALNFLSVSKNQSRKEQIRSIKNKINTVSIMGSFKYHFPHRDGQTRTKKDYSFDIHRIKKPS